MRKMSIFVKRDRTRKAEDSSPPIPPAADIRHSIADDIPEHIANHQVADDMTLLVSWRS